MGSTGLFTSPSGISELDCATTKTDTAERSISIGRESLQVFFVLGALAYFQVPPLGSSCEENWLSFGKFQDTERFLIHCERHIFSQLPPSGGTWKYAKAPIQKKLGEILYVLICSFLPCLSWLLRSRVRKSRRDLRITLYCVLCSIGDRMTGELDMHWSGYGIMKVLPQNLAGVIEEDCENLHQDSNHTLPWYMSWLLQICWPTHHYHVHGSPALTWICPLCILSSDHEVVCELLNCSVSGSKLYSIERCGIQWVTGWKGVSGSGCGLIWHAILALACRDCGNSRVSRLG